MRCKVHFPGKKVPYSEDNCPNIELGDPWIEAKRRMPRLIEFNEILMAMDREPIAWRLD